MQYVINTTEKEYQFLNGYQCKVINSNRDDGYIECYCPAFSILILLKPSELEDY